VCEENLPILGTRQCRTPALDAVAFSLVCAFNEKLGHSLSCPAVANTVPVHSLQDWISHFNCLLSAG
jgi:hypothetical protein